MTDARIQSIRTHMERMMGVPVGVRILDVYPAHVSMFARGYEVTAGRPDTDEPAEDIAARMARAIWMAALSDEPGAFSSEGP